MLTLFVTPQEFQQIRNWATDPDMVPEVFVAHMNEMIGDFNTDRIRAEEKTMVVVKKRSVSIINSHRLMETK